MNRKFALTFLLILLLLLAAAALYLQLAIERTEQEVVRLRGEIQAQQDIQERLLMIDVLLDEVVLLRVENEYLRRQVEEFLETWTLEEFEATAYTHVAVPGVPDINGTGDGLTASGTQVREGVVAVDPAVIPLGSQVWVEGFGWLIAEDTGGAIRGNRIDIFHESRALAMRFGRQYVRVVLPR